MEIIVERVKRRDPVWSAMDAIKIKEAYLAHRLNFEDIEWSERTIQADRDEWIVMKKPVQIVARLLRVSPSEIEGGLTPFGSDTELLRKVLRISMTMLRWREYLRNASKSDPGVTPTSTTECAMGKLLEWFRNKDRGSGMEDALREISSCANRFIKSPTEPVNG